MFNDEMESVRLNAIQSLHKIAQSFSNADGGSQLGSQSLITSSSAVIRLDLYQLMTAVLILQDGSERCRQDAHRMLGLFQVESPEALEYLSNSLFANLKRYPVDLNSIYNCFRDLGRQNFSIVGK